MAAHRGPFSREDISTYLDISKPHSRDILIQANMLQTL